MAALRAELQQLRDTLSREQESSKMELETLQTQLRDKVPRGHPGIPLPAKLRGFSGAGGNGDGGWGGLPAGVAEAVTPASARQESGERELQQRLAEEQFALLQGTAREAERMVQDALGRLEDPAHIGCTGSAGEFFPRRSPNSALTQPDAMQSPPPRCPRSVGEWLCCRV